MGLSRIGAIQLRASEWLLREWEQENPERYKDRAKRLDPTQEAFDPKLLETAVKRTVDALVDVLNRAGEKGLDLVLLPEAILPVGTCMRPDTRDLFADLCTWGPALFFERTAPIAKQHEMIIASCLYRTEGEHIYNDAVLMDERGEIAGIYHKVHLPNDPDGEQGEPRSSQPGTHILCSRPASATWVF